MSKRENITPEALIIGLQRGHRFTGRKLIEHCYISDMEVPRDGSKKRIFSYLSGEITDGITIRNCLLDKLNFDRCDIEGNIVLESLTLELFTLNGVTLKGSLYVRSCDIHIGTDLYQIQDFSITGSDLSRISEEGKKIFDLLKEAGTYKALPSPYRAMQPA